MKMIKSTDLKEVMAVMHKLQSFSAFLVKSGMDRHGALAMYDLMVEELFKDYRELLVEEILAAQKSTNETLAGLK